MARGIPHSDDVKAAVLAALLAGQSVTEVARTYKLNHKTVIEWRNAAGIGSTTVEPEKKNELGALVVKFLTTTLNTLSLQAEHFSDKAWLQEYTPADAAVLFGVMSDKAVRLLEAIESIESAAGGEANQPEGI